MQNYAITVTAKDVLQVKSLLKFKLPYKRNPDGSYIAQDIFSSERSAKDFLTDIALENFDASDQGDKELQQEIQRIESGGELRIDYMIAKIEPQ